MENKEIEKRYIDDEIVLIDKIKGSIILVDNGAKLYDNAIVPYLDKYKIGDKVNLTLYGNPERVMFIKKAGEFKAKKPEIPKPIIEEDKKEKGYVFLNGKWYATLQVLLNRLHELYPGRNRILTNPFKIDYEKKEAVFQTKIQTIDDEGKIICEYYGTGDAGTETLTQTMRPAYIRMAETRSIVRALRWATNIADTALDELLPEEKK